jgi:tetrahydromethanopterin S-methyltransferase subunit B
MPEPTISDVMKEIGKVEGAIEALHRRLDRQAIEMEHLRADVDKLSGVANMGRGALWMALKFGGLIALVTTIIVGAGYLGAKQ